MSLEELKCRSCGAPLTADDIIPEMRIAKCGQCNAVFSVKNLAGMSELFADSAQTNDSPESKQNRAPVEMPKGIEILDIGQALQITYQWFNSTYVGLLLFCIMWNGFMVVWMGIALSKGEWMMAAFGLIHGSVGLGLIYVVVAGFRNTTTIRAGMGSLEIIHGPIPWPGNKTIPSDDIEQAYCKQHISHSKNGGVNYSYSLFAKMRDGRDLKLLSGVKEPNKIIYIEQQLERFLGIEDRAVEGEF